MEIKSNAKDIFSVLKNQPKLFLIHFYIKRKQASSMESATNNLDSKTIAFHRGGSRLKTDWGKIQQEAQAIQGSGACSP